MNRKPQAGVQSRVVYAAQADKQLLIMPCGRFGSVEDEYKRAAKDASSYLADISKPPSQGSLFGSWYAKNLDCEIAAVKISPRCLLVRPPHWVRRLATNQAEYESA